MEKLGARYPHTPLAGNVFQHGFAVKDVFGEGIQGLVAGAQMAVAMAGDLVAGKYHAPEHGRIPFADPAQREEGGVHPGVGHQGEDAFHVRFHTTLPRWPAGAVDVGGKGGNLEVILHVAGHGIADRRSKRSGASGSGRHGGRRFIGMRAPAPGEMQA